VRDHCTVGLSVSSSSDHRKSRVYRGRLARGSSISLFRFTIKFPVVLATDGADVFVPAFRCPFRALTSVPFETRFVVAVIGLFSGLARTFSGRLSSSSDRVKPVHFEILEGCLICEEKVTAFPNASSDAFVQVDNGRVGTR
jgi:hypothetical protein